jgi:predicted small secreted protein
MLLLALGMVAGTVTGCRTAEGAGEDLEDLGDEIEDAVD